MSVRHLDAKLPSLKDKLRMDAEKQKDLEDVILKGKVEKAKKGHLKGKKK